MTLLALHLPASRTRLTPLHCRAGAAHAWVQVRDDSCSLDLTTTPCLPSCMQQS